MLVKKIDIQLRRFPLLHKKKIFNLFWNQMKCYVLEKHKGLNTFSIRLRTSFNESHGIFGELFAWLESIGNLVHFRIDSCQIQSTKNKKEN